jgi:hypothetical protein
MIYIYIYTLYIYIYTYTVYIYIYTHIIWIEHLPFQRVSSRIVTSQKTHRHVDSGVFDVERWLWDGSAGALGPSLSAPGWKMVVLMGKPWENHRKMEVYRLLNVYITMERSTIFHGNNSLFQWAMFNSYVQLPEMAISWGNMMKHGHFMGNIGSLRGNIGGASR